MILIAFSRLEGLDAAFTELLRREGEWPPSPPDMKALYTHFYNEIVKHARNLVCGSCGCIDHDPTHFNLVPVTEHSLRALRVDPSLVPFNFSSGIEEIDNQHIMIDPLGIVQTAGRPSSICICESCQKSLKNNARPPESLAHFRWVGPVPPELQDLTWIEELLIARAHLSGTIVRLQNRNSHFGLKGHAILLPQDTTRLLDILPLPPSALPDIVRVVWVGRPIRSADSLYDHFSVRTQRVYDALLWLTRHNEDYKDVVIDRSEFERWPPVFVVQELLDQIGEVEDESAESDARAGVATEDMDTDDFEGDIPMTTSAIIDIAAVSQPSQLQAIQHISLWKNDATINVVTGNSILSEETLRCYFTAAFPTLFPWGSGKHIDNRRSDSLTLKKWIQLLIRNSSR